MKFKSTIICVATVTLVFLFYYKIFHDDKQEEKLQNLISEEAPICPTPDTADYENVPLYPKIPPRKDVLIYNPVPKTGSTSFAQTLKRLRTF